MLDGVEGAASEILSELVEIRVSLSDLSDIFSLPTGELVPVAEHHGELAQLVEVQDVEDQVDEIHVNLVKLNQKFVHLSRVSTRLLNDEPFRLELADLVLHFVAEKTDVEDYFLSDHILGVEIPLEVAVDDLDLVQRSHSFLS